jgi:Fic family protein
VAPLGRRAGWSYSTAYFEDGNGRTARAIFCWSLLNQGYWLAEFLAVSRILREAPAHYARSFLLTEQDEGDLTHFFIYHLGVIERSIRDLHALSRTQGRRSPRDPADNHRELALLKHALETPGSQYTVVSHSTSHHVSGETARHDLMHLEALQLLVRGKVGRGHVWTPAADLSGRLTEVR